MASNGKRLKRPTAASTATRPTRSTRRSKLVKERATAKFDETVEVAVNLGVDPRHADQMVRGAVILPNGTGKTRARRGVRPGDKAEEAKAAGADIVGAEDLAEQVQARQDRLRPLHRHAGHDGAGRPAR